MRLTVTDAVLLTRLRDNVPLPTEQSHPSLWPTASYRGSSIGAASRRGTWPLRTRPMSDEVLR